jgi:hypothetical protein
MKMGIDARPGAIDVYVFFAMPSASIAVSRRELDAIAY